MGNKRNERRNEQKDGRLDHDRKRLSGVEPLVSNYMRPAGILSHLELEDELLKGSYIL